MSDSPSRAGALSAERRRLLARALRQHGYSAARRKSIPRRQADGPAPLSFAQERFWFFDQLAPGSSFYNDCFAARLVGELDANTLEHCLNAIVDRHEVLRTTFPIVQGQPVQRVAPSVAIALDSIDLRALPAGERQDAVVRLADNNVRQPFDLTRLPLLRTQLLRLTDEEHVLLLTVHHIVFDGWSISVLFHEIATLYAATSEGRHPTLPELRIQYADFAVWQRAHLQGELAATQLRYWQEQLAGHPPLLTLPIDHPRPRRQTFRGDSRRVAFPADLTRAVTLLSRAEGVTPFVTLLAAFQLQLASYAAQDDILVGTPIAGRSHSDVETLIGCFVNTLVLRTNLSGNPTFRGLLARVNQVTLDALNHQDLPFERLVNELKPNRTLEYNPVFQAWFTLLNTPLPVFELPRLKLSFLELESRHARLDIALLLWESDTGVRGQFEYNADLFEPSTMDRVAGDYDALVRAAVARPDASLDTLMATLRGPGRPPGQPAVGVDGARAKKPQDIRRKPIFSSNRTMAQGES